MSYTPTTDFIALLRQAGSGVALTRMPGLDFVVAALARAGLISLSTGQTAPAVNQSTTAWMQPAQPSWTAEGVLWLWDGNAGAYARATPALLFQFLQGTSSSYVFQSTGLTADVVKNATTLMAVQRSAPAATALVLPAIAGRAGRSLRVADWSTGIAAEHSIVFTTPDGATIMRQTSWAIFSTPDQLAGITFHPSIDLNGWVITP